MESVVPQVVQIDCCLTGCNQFCQLMCGGRRNSESMTGEAGIDIPMQSAMLEALVTEAQPHMFDQMLGTAEADFYNERLFFVQSYNILRSL